jgi:hypothetical protein
MIQLVAVPGGNKPVIKKLNVAEVVSRVRALAVVNPEKIVARTPPPPAVLNKMMSATLGRIFAPDTKGSANMYPRARNFFIIRLLSSDFQNLEENPHTRPLSYQSPPLHAIIGLRPKKKNPRAISTEMSFVTTVTPSPSTKKPTAKAFGSTAAIEKPNTDITAAIIIESFFITLLLSLRDFHARESTWTFRSLFGTSRSRS